MKRSIKWVIFSLVIILVGMVGYYGYTFYDFYHNISKQQTQPKQTSTTTTTKNQPSTTTKKPTPKPDVFKKRVNILLMGGDSRGLAKNQIMRSDTIMVLSIDPVTKQASLMSILRDTYVKIHAAGMDRINAALAYGGPKLAMQTVSDFLGIPIHYYVYTDFRGFIALINSLGGIDYNVEKDMHWSDSADGHQFDINLHKGYQHLDGKTALEYVRFRHDAQSDFGRTKRQRAFLKALAQKMETTTSILKLPSILQSIEPYVHTDIPLKTMLQLAYLGYKVKASGLITQQIPPSGLIKEEIVTEGGIKADVLGTDAVKVRQFVHQFIQKTSESNSNTASTNTSSSTN